MQKIIKSFLATETRPGVLVVLATLAALICANSPWAASYQSFLQLPVTIGFTKPLLLWINDGLMAIFFFLIGLEIKRELIQGELSTRAKALQPVFAAVGGMVVPACIYLFVVRNNPELHAGWAIPAATDIAFALAVLGFVGSRVPQAIKVLLVAIAILDDLAAIIIIALFYTGGVDYFYLVMALGFILALTLANKIGMRYLFVYILLGIGLWLCALKAGIHPTLAGVVTALFIPLEKPQSEKRCLLRQTEKQLHPWVSYFIIPIFAFANAGLSFVGMTSEQFLQPVTWAVACGLLFGKPIGVVLGLLCGHLTGLAPKPHMHQWMDYVCIGIISGIGFTMSLFIGHLAFNDVAIENGVKLGVLISALAAILLGLGFSYYHFRPTKQKG